MESSSIVEEEESWPLRFYRIRGIGVRFDSRGDSAAAILQVSGIESDGALRVADVIPITGPSLVEYNAPDRGGAPYFVEPSWERNTD